MGHCLTRFLPCFDFVLFSVFQLLWGRRGFMSQPSWLFSPQTGTMD
ncbi:hypothetical protein LEMLEM_LOCUS8038 [Lemmus lemmus]